MHRVHEIVALTLVTLVSGPSSVSAADPPRSAKSAVESFVICYNPNAPVAMLAVYDLIVVDFAYPPGRIKQLVQKKKSVLGYLSLGKVHRARPFLKDIQRLKIELVRDQAFPDSFQIDVANPNWQKLVIGTIIPRMKKAGFTGLFLDDLDDIEARGLTKQGADLIAAIRQAHPELRLMANRGLGYLPLFAKNVDDVLLESCFALSGKLRPLSDQNWALAQLAAGKGANPKLKGFAVDYYIPQDDGSPAIGQQTLINQVRKLHAQNGLGSCLTVQSLQIVPLP